MSNSCWSPGWQLWQATPECALNVFCSGNVSAGPTALISAGVHGDEYEGPVAVARLAKMLSGMPVRGQILLVPDVNPLARMTATRFTLEDGRNLARSFPGNSKGSVTERLAQAVFEHLVAPSEYIIDLHSGGVEYLFEPLAGFYGEIGSANPSYAAALAFGLPALWQLPPTPGVLSYEAAALGKVAIGHEYLGAGRLSNEGVTAYVEGIRRCLRAWSFLPSIQEQPPMQPRCYTGDWLLCAFAGLFHSNVERGEWVEAGTCLAHIENERGEVVEEIFADRSGDILGLRSKAYIQAGAWAVLLGRRHSFGLA